jgi:transcriptional regulator with XRE-family HTH domain
MSRTRKSQRAWEYDASVGKRIALARRRFRVKALDMAEAIGVSQQALSSYECGRTACPPIILAKIALALGISVSVLIPRTTTCCFIARQPQLNLKSE